MSDQRISTEQLRQGLSSLKTQFDELKGNQKPAADEPVALVPVVEV